MTGIIAGHLNARNKNAIDWHPKGLLGYGCHTVVTIVDVSRCSTIQTLCGHKAAVSHVKFGLQESVDDELNGTVKCISADISGHINMWNVFSGSREASFERTADEIIHMEWFTEYGIHSGLLLTLHASNVLVLWRAESGVRQWVVNFTTKVMDFSVNPTNRSMLALAATNSNVLLLSNVHNKDPPALTDANLSKVAIRTSGYDVDPIFSVQFHQAYENLLFAVSEKRVYLLHAEAKQLLCEVVVDHLFPVCNLLPCGTRNAFYLVHANGVISFWQALVTEHADRFNADIAFVQTLANDAQRFFAKNRIFGAKLCPVTESSVSMLFNTGKVVFYQLNHADQVPMLPARLQSLEDITDASKLSAEDELCFAQNGIVPSLGNNPTNVRMRPMDTVQTAADKFAGKHLAAIGSNTGSIQFIDVFTGSLEKELNVHNCAVKCLEWAGADMVISAAYVSSISTTGTVRNDIVLTNILTGAKKRLRPETDESPIKMLRVSFYQRYLAVVFRNDPLEIWDLQSHRLLRRMSRKCPIIMDIAWSGKHHSKKTGENENHICRENLVVLDNENHLYHVVVKGLHVKDGKEVNTQWKSGLAPIQSMAWKDDLLAFGDVAGAIHVWDLAKRTLDHGSCPTFDGPVLRCVFSRLSGDATVAVQYTNGVVLFDGSCLKQTSHVIKTESTLVDMDMFGVTPLVISVEGIFRFAASTGGNNAVNESEIPQLVNQSFAKQIYETTPATPGETKISALGFLAERLATEESQLAAIALQARFLGNLPLLRLILLLESLQSGKQPPPNLSFFWQASDYRTWKKTITKVLLGSVKSQEQQDFAVERAIVLGNYEWAKYALLNSDLALQGDAYRLNAYKGCVLNSRFDNEESRCFIKMIATNLIAENHISDGICLLFLIDQGLDACRFLSSTGHDLRCIQYAKAAAKDMSNSFLTKHAEHLQAGDRVSRTLAALLTASLGRSAEAIDMLSPSQHPILTQVRSLVT